MNFLIVGSNFGNKGAQSMLFTCVYELRRRFPDAVLYMLCLKEIPNKDNLTFPIIRYDKYSYPYALGTISLIDSLHRKGAILKSRLKKTEAPYQHSLDLKHFLLSNTFDSILDISGYAISSSCTPLSDVRVFQGIQLAHKLGIPVYLLPQSFGPFEYGNRQATMEAEIKRNLELCRIIFAREPRSYQELTDRFHLTNASYSPDLVLSTQGPPPESIYRDPVTLNYPSLRRNHLVGIIPNQKSVIHSNKKHILCVYKEIVDQLLALNKTVVIYRHSGMDRALCRSIKMMYLENEHVLLNDNDFSCFEYDRFTSQMDYVIAGRFHSVVHAYRNSIPSIVLGWADKYQHLASLVGQDQYVFGITDPSVNVSEICSAIRDMESRRTENSRIIQKNVSQLQSRPNCFDEFEDDFRQVRALQKTGRSDQL